MAVSILRWLYASFEDSNMNCTIGTLLLLLWSSSGFDDSALTPSRSSAMVSQIKPAAIRIRNPLDEPVRLFVWSRDKRQWLTWRSRVEQTTWIEVPAESSLTRVIASGTYYFVLRDVENRDHIVGDLEATSPTPLRLIVERQRRKDPKSCGRPTATLVTYTLRAETD